MTNDEAPIAERVLFRRFRDIMNRSKRRPPALRAYSLTWKLYELEAGSERNQDRSLVKRNFVLLVIFCAESVGALKTLRKPR